MEIVTSWMEEGIQRGRQEGRQEGHQEGRQQTLREDIIEVLEARFGEIPYALREQILAVVGEAELKRLHRQAVLVTDLPTFRHPLAQSKAD